MRSTSAALRWSRICGGEPMIYPGIGELVAKILERKKVVYLCTNGMFIRKKIAEFKPHAGSSSTSTSTACGRATTSPSSARASSTRPSTASRPPRRPVSWSARTRPSSRKPTWRELDELFAYLTTLDVDGFLISPGYSYAAVGSKEIFMTRDDIRAKFRAAEAMFRKYKFYSSPVYLEFLQGKRELTCTAWANPTRNIKGWKGPCYLITDIHHASFDDLLNKTPWEKYGYGNDPQVRELHDALGLRDDRRAGGQRPARRHAEDGQVAVPLSRRDLTREPPGRLRGESSTAGFANEKP